MEDAHENSVERSAARSRAQRNVESRVWTSGARPGSALLISAYFLFIFLFVSLKGNFPLNDDWSYGEGVRGFVQTGRLIMPTVCAAGFTHIFLGAVGCKIFGFSYVVLRAVVFVWAIIGSFALYGALIQTGIRRGAAVFCSLVYACNPIIVNLYFSFMSDVTALSLVNIYLYLLLRACRKNSVNLALLSIVALTLAVGARQSAIIFLPCNLSLLALKIDNRRLLSWVLIASVAIPVLSYIGMDQWLIHRSFSVHDYIDVKEGHWQLVQNMLRLPVHGLHAFIVAMGESACYLGLFCLPVLLSILLQGRKILTKYAPYLWHWLLMAGCMVMISANQLVIAQSKLMPFNQNLLRLPMVCALTIMGLNMPLLSGKTLRWITMLSFVLAFVLLAALGAMLQMLVVKLIKYIKAKTGSRRQLAIIWICVVAALISTIFSAAETIIRCTDRYYLIALAPLLLSLAIVMRRLKLKIVQPPSVIALLLIAIYSACAAQDYLGWNRARWTGLERLEARGIPSTQIDGGYEYNTLRDIKIYDSANHGLPPRNAWRWWPVKGENYIVSFSPIPDYKVVDRLPYWSALGFKAREVLILQSEDKN